MIKGNESGFTLIELLVTITIAALVFGGIVNVYIGIETAQRKTYHMELATRAGEQQIESLRNNLYTNLVPGENIDFTASLPAALPSPKTGTVAVSEPSTGLRRVDLTITYDDGSGAKTIKQSSLIGILGIAQ
jgi:prepilin-type N-terminal cleavage/methylation domain-containing protein